jgi:hypothetical protein
LDSLPAWNRVNDIQEQLLRPQNHDLISHSDRHEVSGAEQELSSSTAFLQ